MGIKDTRTLANFARMSSVDAIVHSALSKTNKNKNECIDELQRTALLILALLENEGTTFHERLYATTNESDEKEPTIDKTRREYVDVFLKKIFLKAEESGCLRDDFAEKHGEKLLASASLETNESEDGKKDMTKKMFVYENATIQETGETFEELLNEEEEEEDTISPYENLSEITLSLSKNLFAGNTGAHEWTAGFKLAELAINEPGLVYNKTVLELGSGAGLAAVAMLRSQPLRMILTDKSRESNDNLERNVRENISKTTTTTTTTIGNVTIQRENASDPLPPMPTGEDVYRKEALASKNRTEEEEMGFTYSCENIDSFISIRELDWFSEEETLKTVADVINPDLIVASDVGYDPDLLPGLINTLDIFLRKRSSSRKYMWLEPETSEDAFDMLFSPRPSEVPKPCIALIVNAKRQEETNEKFDQLLKEKKHLVAFDVTEYALQEKAFLGFDDDSENVVVRVIFASSSASVLYAKREGSKKDDPESAVVRRGRYVL